MKRYQWGLAAILLVCAFGKISLAQPLYFEPKVSSGTFSEEIKRWMHEDEIDLYTGYSWTVKDVCDFNRDGAPDIVYQSSYARPHGAIQQKIVLEKGVQNGGNHFWEEWSAWGGPPGVDCAIGDWDGDGEDDLSLFVGRDDSITPRFVFFRGDSIEIVKPRLIVSSADLELNGSYTGDFNGDGLDDFFQRGAIYLSVDSLVYKRIIQPLPIQFTTQIEDVYREAVADLNRDGCDDVLFWQRGRLFFLYGNANTDRIFTVTQTYECPIQATGFDVEKVFEGKPEFVGVHSATEMMWIKPGMDGIPVLSPITLPDPFSPNAVRACDLNRDEEVDLISWSGRSFHLYLGGGESNFLYQSTIAFPENCRIKTVFVRDANGDGKNDILVFSENGDLVTYHRRDIPQPPPTPTPTPFPTLPPAATPTPIVPNGDLVVVRSDKTLDDMLLTTGDSIDLVMEPGNYRSTYYPFYFPEISDKWIRLIGMDPNNRSVIERKLQFKNCNLYWQNLFFFYPYPLPESMVNLINCEASLVYCRISGPIEYRDSYGGDYREGGPTMIICDVNEKTMVFVDNWIEAGSKNINIHVQRCQNTLLDFQKNPMLGLNNRIAHVQIEDCTNVKILLREVDNPYYPRSLTTVTVKSSSVEVCGGVVRGCDGFPGVIGEDGGHGIWAENGSLVALDGTEVYGGRGGDGVEPGQDGEAIVIRDTSQVIRKTVVEEWVLQ